MSQSYPQLGSLLTDRYRLVREIGEGGMGVVFEAQNTVTQKRVAIKWLHSSIASNPEAAKRLVREATATCRVRHPNVVDVYDVVHEQDALFLVMELLEGEQLEAVLRRGGIPLHQLVALLLPAMRGVAEAHRHGIIHRDIHPANIFLARQPHGAAPVPKVLDFGISKIAGDDTPSLTRSGATMGTPLYMSFEQLCSASDVDARTDVYSFGVILYEALTGRPPFEAESFAELAVKIATAVPMPPKDLQPAIPLSLQRLILWAMERDRDLRVENMELFIRELEPFASEHAFRAQMTESDRDLPSVIPRADRLSRTPRAQLRTPSAVRAIPSATLADAPALEAFAEEPEAEPASERAARSEPHAARDVPTSKAPQAARRGRTGLLVGASLIVLLAASLAGPLRTLLVRDGAAEKVRAAPFSAAARPAPSLPRAPHPASAGPAPSAAVAAATRESADDAAGRVAPITSPMPGPAPPSTAAFPAAPSPNGSVASETGRRSKPDGKSREHIECTFRAGCVRRSDF